MEQANQNIRPRKSQLNQQEVFRIMEEFEKSDKLCARRFCEQHKMTKGNFYYWIKRYRKRQAGMAVTKGFIPLVVKTTSSFSSPGSWSLFAEVNGIRLYQPVPAEYLKTLAS